MYEPRHMNLVTPHVAARMRIPELRRLASDEKIPYWREMRVDELRAVLVVMSDRG